jgi:DNA-binding CsgD family transcriptional regulator
MIALHRARADNIFTVRDVAAMRELLPHFLEALAINTVVGNATRPRSAPHCTGIADQDRSLLFAEGGLRRLLQAEWPSAEADRVPLPLWEALSRTGRYEGAALVAESSESHGMVFIRVRRRCAADGLSLRELQAARLDSAGFTYKEIARQMGTAPVSARNVLQRVHEKLGARNRGEVSQALALLG